MKGGAHSSQPCSQGRRWGRRQGAHSLGHCWGTPGAPLEGTEAEEARGPVCRGGGDTAPGGGTEQQGRGPGSRQGFTTGPHRPLRSPPLRLPRPSGAPSPRRPRPPFPAPVRLCPRPGPAAMSCFEEEGSWNLSFAGAGFLGIYHVGVTHCLRERAPRLLRGARRVYGSSSGTLNALCIVMGESVGASRASAGEGGRGTRKPPRKRNLTGGGGRRGRGVLLGLEPGAVPSSLATPHAPIYFLCEPRGLGTMVTPISQTRDPRLRAGETVPKGHLRGALERRAGNSSSELQRGGPSTPAGPQAGGHAPGGCGRSLVAQRPPPHLQTSAARTSWAW